MSILQIIGIVCLAGCLAALVWVVIAHMKEKKISGPIMVFLMCFLLFVGCGIMHSIGFEIELPDGDNTIKQNPVNDAPTLDGETGEVENNFEENDQNSDSPVSKESNNSSIVFDALQYKFTDSVSGNFLTSTESELVEILGDPEKIDEWNFRSGTGLEYPIRSLAYESGNYVYEFNNDRLVRIQIFEQFSFENKADIPTMFGLELTGTSESLDTGATYKVTDCGVHELQCTFGRAANTIDITFISYVDIFD